MTRPAERSSPSFPLVLTLASALALAILLGLGVWQVQRLAWKEDLIARIAARKAALAQPLEAALSRGGDLEFTRVTADCPGLGAAPFVELYTLLDGQPGSRLVSVCRTPGGPWDGVLVDRGFVAETISARPRSDGSTSAPARVEGVLRRPDTASVFTPQRQAQGRFFSRDIAAMATALGLARPAPWMLAAETSTNPEWQALQPRPLPAEIPNSHLGYAITWFGLAAALVGVYFALLRRRLRPKGSE